jgi:hypothetical protein
MFFHFEPYNGNILGVYFVEFVMLQLLMPRKLLTTNSFTPQ